MNLNVLNTESKQDCYLRKGAGWAMVFWFTAMTGLAGCHHIFPFLDHDHGSKNGQEEIVRLGQEPYYYEGQ